MLDNYGIHIMIWDAADERPSDFLVASPADAAGRGIELHVRREGVPVDLTGANVYFLWRHRKAGTRGCEPFSPVDSGLGVFRVYYPAAMQSDGGAVDAQCMVSWGVRAISTRVFTIRVEPVLVGGSESDDGFTLFLEAIKKYEDAAGLSHEAADAANAAAATANDAAASANRAEADLRAAAESGAFDGRDGVDGADGADGKDGRDGVSPSASVSQDGDAAILTVTDASGTTTATVLQGPKGDAGEAGPQGERGEQGPRGEKGETGERGAQGIQGEAGPAGEIGPQGEAGPRGEKGETGGRGLQGDRGESGADGVSCTHAWNGSVLTVTSASGTSSADLRGPEGPKGDPGADGADGLTFVPASPLSLEGGTLSIDLSGYATKQYVDQALASLADLGEKEF